MLLITKRGTVGLRPKGRLRVAVGFGGRTKNAGVGLYGTPEALRNLAALLTALADLDQKKLAQQSCPPGEGFHVDVMPQVYPSKDGAVSLIIGRLDARGDGGTD